MNKLVMAVFFFIGMLSSLSACSSDKDSQKDFPSVSSLIEGKESQAVKDSNHPFQMVPKEYLTQSKKQGTIVRLDYKTNSYDTSQRELEKYAYVYLPYGYNTKNIDTRYNILYLMHGGSGSPETLFGGLKGTTILKNILDNMIEAGDIDPLIVVTPTYYNEGNRNDGQLTANFYQELMKDLMPAVEGTYHTYAKTTDEEGFKASRGHRAFGGYSMGSVTTWYTFVHNLDYFKYFMPLSGDSWVVEQFGGRSKPDATAEYLHNVAVKSGYEPDEYYIYSCVGSEDVAYEPLSKQIEAMRKYTDSFIYGFDFPKENLYLCVAKDGTHDYEYGSYYIYNVLPNFFRSVNTSN